MPSPRMRAGRRKQTLQLEAIQSENVIPPNKRRGKSAAVFRLGKLCSCGNARTEKAGWCRERRNPVNHVLTTQSWIKEGRHWAFLQSTSISRSALKEGNEIYHKFEHVTEYLISQISTHFVIQCALLDTDKDRDLCHCADCA